MECRRHFIWSIATSAVFFCFIGFCASVATVLLSYELDPQLAYANAKRVAVRSTGQPPRGVGNIWATVRRSWHACNIDTSVGLQTPAPTTDTDPYLIVPPSLHSEAFPWRAGWSGRFDSWCVVARGWPLLCAYAYYHTSDPSWYQGVVKMHGGICLKRHSTKYRPSVLPFVPMAGGLAGNTLFFGGLCAGIRVSISSLIRRRRKAHSQCPHCGYPADASRGVCSECGSGLNGLVAGTSHRGTELQAVNHPTLPKP